MYVCITLLVLFLVLFSSACLYMTVCIDLCALTPPVCGLSFISIKFCSVLFFLSKIRVELCKLSDHALYLYQVPQNISKGFRVTQFPYFNVQRG